MARITYHGEGIFEEDDLDLSLLDISLKHGIPHSHVCGRIAACSTCRVTILEGHENILPPREKEKEFIKSEGWPDNIRLACQTYLKGPVTIRRIVKDDTDVEMSTQESFRLAGSEIDLAIMFTDIRKFTGFSERYPAYDVFHILNRYYEEMGEAVLQNHGYIHQYLGDGMMALFGFYARDPQQICLDAVSAGLEMLERLPHFNRFLKKTLGEEFKIGIGIHFGKVIAGRIGHSKSLHLNVLGDVVNAASRIQDATKKTNSPLVISDAVYWELGATVIKVTPFKTELRGKSGKQRLYEVAGFASGFNRSRNLLANARGG